MATSPTSGQLLVIIDPVARRTDGESVRIAKDVLSAGATSTKVCLPDGPEEFARALARRGSRRPVVIGDDRALTRAVTLLHRQRALTACVLSVVPVGGSLSVAHALGVPTGAVAAARAVLDGAERRLDLLVDDSDGVVLGSLRIPAPPAAGDVLPPDGSDPSGPSDASDPSGPPWLRSLVRTLVPARPNRSERHSNPSRHSSRHSLPSWPSRTVAAPLPPGPARLRVEVDGATLVDLDQPVETVSVTPGAPGTGGTVEVVVRPSSVGAEAAPLQAYGRTVTVSGADFHYRADAAAAGPVRRRAWTVREGALGLMLPER